MTPFWITPRYFTPFMAPYGFVHTAETSPVSVAGNLSALDPKPQPLGVPLRTMVFSSKHTRIKAVRTAPKVNIRTKVREKRCCALPFIFTHKLIMSLSPTCTHFYYLFCVFIFPFLEEQGESRAKQGAWD